MNNPSHEVIPPAIRAWMYVVVVLGAATASLLNGIGTIDDSTHAAITTFLSLVSGGLALGFVPRTRPDAPVA